jgi:spore coat polysaccharide biosynthesis protein SpsF
MSTLILVTARLGSQRLKRKHLLEASHRPFISHLIDRITYEFKNEIDEKNVRIVIATTTEPENEAFKKLDRPWVDFFAGSIDHIPLRHQQAAKHFCAQYLISVDGDDILCSPQALRKIYDGLKTGAHYVQTKNLPFGMNAHGYSTACLNQALKSSSQEVMETGWGRIFSEVLPQVMEVPFTLPVGSKIENFRFTLDYPEDEKFFQQVIEGLGSQIQSASDSEILDYAWKTGAYRMNEAKSAEYWDNFNRQLASE